MTIIANPNQWMWDFQTAARLAGDEPRQRLGTLREAAMGLLTAADLDDVRHEVGALRDPGRMLAALAKLESKTQ